MLTSVILSLFLTTSLAKPLPQEACCSAVSFEVQAASENVVFGNPPDPNNTTDIQEFLLNSFVSGPNITGSRHIDSTYTIKGVYCKPPGNVKARDTLQFLVHGFLYNKTVWSGLDIAPEYDWQQYAIAEGYHTLAVDRVGYGENPQHPDPVSELQGPVHISVFHSLIQSIRAGTLSPLQSFNRIAYVGHSYGSALATHLGLQYPEDIDAYVLTGFSGQATPPPNFATDLTSAASVWPDRFAGVPLGYFTDGTESVMTSVFYGGDYDPEVAHRDFLGEDVTTPGEFLSPGNDLAETKYTGPVYVITGENDKIFCGQGPETCEQTVASAKGLYPEAKFNHTVVPRTGHTLTMHLAAPKILGMVHEWLDKAL